MGGVDRCAAGRVDTDVVSPGASWRSGTRPGGPRTRRRSRPSSPRGRTPSAPPAPGWTRAASTGPTDGRRLVLPAVAPPARRTARRRGSMPTHWGFGGIVADGGVTAADVRTGARGPGAAPCRAAPGHPPEPAPRSPLRRSSHRTTHSPSRGGRMCWISPGASRSSGRASADSRRRGVRKAEKSGIEVEYDTTGRLLPEFFELYASSEARWAEQQHEPAVLGPVPHALSRHARRSGSGSLRHLDGGCRQWVARHDGSRGRVDRRAVRRQRALHARRDGQGAGRAAASQRPADVARDPAACASESARRSTSASRARSASLVGLQGAVRRAAVRLPGAAARAPAGHARRTRAARTVVKRVIGFREP